MRSLFSRQPKFVKCQLRCYPAVSALICAALKLMRCKGIFRRFAKKKARMCPMKVSRLSPAPPKALFAIACLCLTKPLSKRDLMGRRSQGNKSERCSASPTASVFSIYSRSPPRVTAKAHLSKCAANMMTAQTPPL